MDENNKLQEYLQAMRFKKAVIGGVDEEDVLIHIKKICDMAREEMERQIGVYETLAYKKQEEIDSLQSQMEHYRDECQQLKVANGQLENRIEGMQAEVERYGTARARAEQEEKKYLAKHRELFATVETLHNVKDEAERSAREEMRRALRAEEESARSRMLEEIEEERAAASREIKHLHDEIASLTRKRQAMEESMRHKREQWKKHLDFFTGFFDEDADEDLLK